jgi:hypothetical protein
MPVPDDDADHPDRQVVPVTHAGALCPSRSLAPSGWDVDRPDFPAAVVAGIGYAVSRMIPLSGANRAGRSRRISRLMPR